MYLVISAAPSGDMPRTQLPSNIRYVMSNLPLYGEPASPGFVVSSSHEAANNITSAAMNMHFSIDILTEEGYWRRCDCNAACHLVQC